jgi:hypothetical protein
MAIVRIEDPEAFVGLEVGKAKSEITAHGYECRIVHVDNRTIHADYKPDYDPLRCNLTVKAGKVVKATIG